MAADFLLARVLNEILQEQRTAALPEDVMDDIQSLAFSQTVGINKYVCFYLVNT